MSTLIQTKSVHTLLPKPQQISSMSWFDRTVILEDHINLFCWKRIPDPTIQRYLQRVLHAEPKPIRLGIQLNKLADQLKKARKVWEATGVTGGDMFWSDAQQLTEDFLKLANSKTATVHLRMIVDNACTKFHTDGYTLRLFSTYFGRGTEWIPEVATDRMSLGKSNALIVKDPSEIQQMEAFEVGILKGESSDQPKKVKGIVHRSPEIAKLNEKRIILRIDI